MCPCDARPVRPASAAGLRCTVHRVTAPRRPTPARDQSGERPVGSARGTRCATSRPSETRGGVEPPPRRLCRPPPAHAGPGRDHVCTRAESNRHSRSVRFTAGWAHLCPARAGGTAWSRTRGGVRARYRAAPCSSSRPVWSEGAVPEGGSGTRPRRNHPRPRWSASWRGETRTPVAALTGQCPADWTTRHRYRSVAKAGFEPATFGL